MTELAQFALTLLSSWVVITAACIIALLYAVYRRRGQKAVSWFVVSSLIFSGLLLSAFQGWQVQYRQLQLLNSKTMVPNTTLIEQEKATLLEEATRKRVQELEARLIEKNRELAQRTTPTR